MIFYFIVETIYTYNLHIVPITNILLHYYVFFRKENIYNQFMYTNNTMSKLVNSCLCYNILT